MFSLAICRQWGDKFVASGATNDNRKHCFYWFLIYVPQLYWRFRLLPTRCGTWQIFLHSWDKQMWPLHLLKHPAVCNVTLQCMQQIGSPTATGMTLENSPCSTNAWIIPWSAHLTQSNVLTRSRTTWTNFVDVTVLPTKSDSDVMFCLQSYKGAYNR